MHKKSIILILVCFHFNPLFAQNSDVDLIISDSINVELRKSGRIETIEVQIWLLNNTNTSILINKQNGITETGSLTGEFIPDFCDKSNFRGEYRFFIFDSINQALLDSPLMSVGDFIYFTNAGKIQCVSLEGVDNSNKIEKELKRKTKSQSYPVIISLAPSEEIKYKAKIYLGNYQFAKNHAYYLILVYNSKERTDLSNICLKSNRLTLITK